ncbi:hypothetical protein [Streptomyces sp. NPDC059881]|uniref:hypothetical protein n=1 Tax=Streptomyces sp. NPDC059881 TaxID=3346986 RepID=UPI003646CD72
MSGAPAFGEVDDGLSLLVHRLHDRREAMCHREEGVHRLANRNSPIAVGQEVNEIADGHLGVWHGQPPLAPDRRTSAAAIIAQATQENPDLDDTIMKLCR